MTPGRGICSKAAFSSEAAAEAYHMVCTENHQLLPRLFSETLLYFQNTFCYLNNEGTGEYL